MFNFWTIHGSHLGFLYQSENSYFLPLNYTNPSQTIISTFILIDIKTDISTDSSADILAILTDVRTYN